MPSTENFSEYLFQICERFKQSHPRIRLRPWPCWCQDTAGRLVTQVSGLSDLNFSQGVFSRRSASKIPWPQNHRKRATITSLPTLVSAAQSRY